MALLAENKLRRAAGFCVQSALTLIFRVNCPMKYRATAAVMCKLPDGQRECIRLVDLKLRPVLMPAALPSL